MHERRDATLHTYGSTTKERKSAKWYQREHRQARVHLVTCTLTFVPKQVVCHLHGLLVGPSVRMLDVVQPHRKVLCQPVNADPFGDCVVPATRRIALSVRHSYDTSGHYGKKRAQLLFPFTKVVHVHSHIPVPQHTPLGLLRCIAGARRNVIDQQQ